MERIKIVENGITIDINELKKILIYEWPEIYEYYYKLGEKGYDLHWKALSDIADCADGLMYRTEELA